MRLKQDKIKKIVVEYQMGSVLDLADKLGGRVLVFGGVVRTLLMKEKLGDLDIKILLPKKKIALFCDQLQSLLKSNNWLYQIMIAEDLKVFHLPSLAVDIVVPMGNRSLRRALSTTFTLTSINFDLKTNCLFSFETGWEDFESRTLRFAPGYGHSPSTNYLYFRAIYLSLKTKFKLERKLLINLWKKRSTLPKVLTDCLADDNLVSSKALLVQIFGGRKINPNLYDNLLKKLGIFEQIKVLIQVHKNQIRKKLLSFDLHEKDYFFGELSL